MKIAMLGHKRIPSREGGIEIVVEELSERMVKRGHEVTCYNRNGHHVSGKQFDLKKNQNCFRGINIKNVPSIPYKGLAAVSSSFFASIYAAFGSYDVVHFHAEGPAFMCWLPKIMKKKVVVTIHGLDHQREKWGKFAQSYIMLGEKNAVRYADDIIVLSENVRQYFWGTYHKATQYIPNGVNKPTIRKANQIKEIYGLENNNYILYLGRIVPEKGLRYLVDAFKNVQTNKKLVIAGGASDTDDFVNELKKRSAEDDRIIFTGFVQGNILDELYSNAYVYVLPSNIEGMPLSLLEAMSYGNCCLVSDIEECTSVVEDKAYVFQKENVNDLCDKLQILCDNEQKVCDMKAVSSDFICGKYNWEDVVNQTLLLYGR